MYESLIAPTEEDAIAEGEISVDGNGEEAEPMKHAADPGPPTMKQVEEHRETHVPFRSWCKWCVLGRGRGMQHRKAGTSTVPIVGVDYFFLTKGGVRTRKELDFSMTPEGETELEAARSRGDLVKYLLVRCFQQKAVFAHLVPQKGLDEKNIACDFVLGDLGWLGHTRLIMKSDNEPAVKALVARVIELVKVECKDFDQISKEQSAAYDSQSNGGTEVGIRLVRGLLRTIKLCLEARIGKYIPVDHAVMPWMMEHACLLLNVLVRGDDGITPWQRVRGRPFGQQMLGFGESVLYRYPNKGPLHAPDGNTGALGAEGTFLGYSTGSNTFRVMSDQGLVAARSMTRRSQDAR
jgi:hypothetical protein